MITALLYLDERPATAIKPINQMRRGFPHGHDIGHLNQGMITGRKGLRLQLFRVADDPVDLLDE